MRGLGLLGSWGWGHALREEAAAEAGVWAHRALRWESLFTELAEDERVGARMNTQDRRARTPSLVCQVVCGQRSLLLLVGLPGLPPRCPQQRCGVVTNCPRKSPSTTVLRRLFF